MTLVETLKEDARRRQDEAGRAYRAALERAGGVDAYRAVLASDDPGRLGELQRAMATLGLTEADVEADAAALAAHRRALAGVLDDDGRAEVAATADRERAAVATEARAALAAAVDAVPDAQLPDLVRDVVNVALERTRDMAERTRLIALNRGDEWFARATTAGRAAADRLKRSEAAAAEAAHLVAAHPRVLGDVAAVVGDVTDGEAAAGADEVDGAESDGGPAA